MDSIFEPRNMPVFRLIVNEKLVFFRKDFTNGGSTKIAAG